MLEVTMKCDMHGRAGFRERMRAVWLELGVSVFRITRRAAVATAGRARMTRTRSARVAQLAYQSDCAGVPV